MQLIESLESRAYLSVDLTASVSFAAPASLQIKPGHSAAIAVTVVNNGSTLAAGKLGIVAGLSLNSNGSSPVDSITANQSIHLAPGAHKVFRIAMKVPAGFTPGAYFATADVDPNNTFSETNITNNSAVSVTTLTVLPPYPNLMGTWVGTYKVTKGVGKGNINNLVWDITSEDQANGAFACTTTTTLSSGSKYNDNAPGTISASGALVSNADSVAVFGVFKSKGKVVGSVLKGTFADAIGGGTFTLTHEI